MYIINEFYLLYENAEIDYGLPDDFDDAQNNSIFDASTLIDMSTESMDNFVYYFTYLHTFVLQICLRVCPHSIAAVQRVHTFKKKTLNFKM